MILVVMTILIILIFGLYAFAPHPPPIPEQLMDVNELEPCPNRLIDSGNPPGIVVDRVRSGNYALRNL